MNGCNPILQRFNLHYIISPLVDQGKSERKEQMNKKNPFKASRKGGTVTCARCLTLGHNSRACTLPFHPNSKMNKANRTPKQPTAGSAPQSNILETQANMRPPKLQTRGQSGSDKSNSQPNLSTLWSNQEGGMGSSTFQQTSSSQPTTKNMKKSPVSKKLIGRGD